MRATERTLTLSKYFVNKNCDVCLKVISPTRMESKSMDLDGLITRLLGSERREYRAREEMKERG